MTDALLTRTARATMALRMRYARARAAGQLDPAPIPDRDPGDYTRPPAGTRPPPVRPPPVPPTTDWPKITLLKHSVWGEVENAANKAWTGVEFGASGPPTGKGHAVLNLPAGMSHHGLVWDNCRFGGLGGDGCNMLWLLRGFDVLAPIFRYTEFAGSVWEHGAYLGAPQGLTFDTCRFNGMRAAAIQIAHRWWMPDYTHETIMPEAGKVESVHLIRKCEFIDIGDPASERFGAWTVSEHPAQVYLEDGTFLPDINANVVIDACTFKGGNFEHSYSGQVWRSNRSIMVGNRKSLTIQDTVVDCPQPVHGWAAQAHSVGEVTLLNSHFVGGGKIEIKNAKSVRIQGCTGDAWVRVGTGPGLGEGLTQVEYEGPIKNAYAKGVA